MINLKFKYGSDIYDLGTDIFNVNDQKTKAGRQYLKKKHFYQVRKTINIYVLMNMYCHY